MGDRCIFCGDIVKQSLIPICKDCVTVVSELSRKKKEERIVAENKGGCIHSPMPARMWTSDTSAGYTCTFCGEWVRVNIKN